MERKHRVVVFAAAAVTAALGLPQSGQAGPVTGMAAHVSPFGRAGIWVDDEYPLQGAGVFTLEATLTKVDVERDRLSLTADNGRKYVADAYDVKITLLDRPGKGEVGDLVPGMRVRIRGYLLSADIIAADRLRVLPLAASTAEKKPPVAKAPLDERPSSIVKTPQDTRPPAQKTAKVPAATGRYYHPEPIRMRGTVDSVDDATGTIVIRVKDHTRTVLVSSTTDLTDITDVDDTHIGINPGDRITVQGTLQQNGTVKATGISRSRNIEKVATRPVKQADTDHQVIGHISRTSSKLSDRDIKIVTRPGQEVEVQVGRGVPVLRHGERISVHDLTRDDIVRVEGDYDGDGFKATQVEVLEAYPPM